MLSAFQDGSVYISCLFISTLRNQLIITSLGFGLSWLWLSAAFLFGSLFDREDGGNIFIRNVGPYPNCTMLQPRRQRSAYPNLFSYTFHRSFPSSGWQNMFHDRINQRAKWFRCIFVSWKSEEPLPFAVRITPRISYRQKYSRPLSRPVSEYDRPAPHSLGTW
jgi:hypothetical protein